MNDRGDVGVAGRGGRGSFARHGGFAFVTYFYFPIFEIPNEFLPLSYIAVTNKRLD